MYLVRVSVKGEIDPVDSGVYLIPEFKRLFDSKRYGVTAFKAVALYCDFESPFRFQEEGANREKAIASRLYGKNKIPYWDSEPLANAREAYNFLQRDPIREHLKTLIQNLKDFDEALAKEPKTLENMGKIVDIRKKMKTLREEIQEVKDEVANSASTIKIKGNREMSWLEERHFILSQQAKAEQ